MSAMSDSPNTTLGMLSAPQQREMLWSDARRTVYALILGARIPGLRARFTQDAVDDWDGLWTGELDADERVKAPVLVTLRRDSPFTDWLLDEAAADFGAWGAIALSSLPFLAMRMHGRVLCKAQLPNGQAIRIDWMDPEVMEALLPVASPDQLQRVFSGVDALITLAPGRWTRWTRGPSGLAREIHGVK
jgi:hypothetical protein